MPCALYRSVSRSTLIGSTMSEPFASGDSRFSVTAIKVTPFARQMSMIGSSSCVFPPREASSITSPFCRKPVAPCTASAGEMKRAGRSMQHIRCAKCRQAMPVCPQPLAPMRSAL
ncbi:MAG: hypothetical protein BWY81_00391 [Firmicutes bacterium ADurb.Bin467]|nr:MAG: hypothetical protein BWY81_00391 [Firmicutes bacterium ADurb.Bin467]